MSQNGGRSRREREEEFRRNIVIDAAEILFSEKGFDGTTVTDIAERSELAKGSLYQLFKSKQEIVDAIVDRKVAEMHDTLGSIFSKDISPMEKLFLVMDSKLRAIWHNRRFAKLFITEFHGFNWYMEIPVLKRFHESVKEMLGRIESVIIEGQEAGQIRKDIPHKLILASMGGISNAIIHLWLREEVEVDIDEVVEMARDLFFNGVQPLKGDRK